MGCERGPAAHAAFQAPWANSLDSPALAPAAVAAGSQNLNAFIDDLSQGRAPRYTRLEFYVRDGPQLRRVEATLGGQGGVAPLLYAFGLISAEELQASDSSGLGSGVDTNFLDWLREQVQDAVRTADKHDVLKWHIRRLKNSLEERFQLAAVQVVGRMRPALQCCRTLAWTHVVACPFSLYPPRVVLCCLLRSRVCVRLVAAHLMGGCRLALSTRSA